MDCQQAFDLLPEFVLGTLTESELAHIQQHLASGCSVCRKEHDELAGATSLMAETLDPVAPPAALKRDILARIADEPQIVPATTTVTLPQRRTAEPPSRPSFIPYVAASLAALAAGSLVANFNQQAESVAVGDPALRFTPEWRQRVQAAERVFGPPRARLASFAKNKAKLGFRVTIFQDPVAEQLHVVVSETPTPADGTSSWIWLLDEDGKSLACARLQHLGGKRAAAVLDLAALPPTLQEVVVTFEPVEEPQPVRPTGEPVGSARLLRSS